MPVFFIGGGRNDVDGGLLGRLYGALLLEYGAKDEIGAVLPYRLVPSILIGSVNDVRQLAGAPLMDYNAVEDANFFCASFLNPWYFRWATCR